ncbi:hypothetical protein [Micromonospora sp. NPDC049679]|uniref:hypothetical protein n=1 Tax=Micromonospora sp. NPDC049679 TaxID=3155920 RepID=UPI0034118B41
MVYVRLDAEWTDGGGVSHAAGEMVDVDAATLADLESKGIVHSDGTNWAGPTGDNPTGGKEGITWAGPTTDPQAWAGPTSDRP